MMRAAIAALVAGLLLAPSALGAGEPPPFTSASAVWTADGEVNLIVTYDGGACEAADEPQIEAGGWALDVVVIPTYATADVCTMQIVPVTFEELITVQPDTERLSVLVLNTEGWPQAAGYVDILRP